MKTVGIMTFHFADNYGAVLQCYALRKVINCIQGYKADIINYIPTSYRYPKHWKNIYTKQKFKEKRRMFDEFLEKQCGIYEEACSYIDGKKYDYYCAGSDQVWNTNSLYEEYFFPHVASEVKRISYAASVGVGINSSFLKKEMFSRYLPGFKAISVREEEHVGLIEKLSGKKCERVLDPTLLLKSDEYEDIICKSILREDKFIFFYWLAHSNPAPGVELANRLSRFYDIPVVHSLLDSPSYMFNKDGGCMFYEGIENFLWYVKNAQFVVTNSYHGTIFSIHFKRPFYTLIEDSMRSRMDTLMGIMNIRDRMVEKYLVINQNPEDVDFTPIEDAIKMERKKSLDFLKRAIDCG